MKAAITLVGQVVEKTFLSIAMLSVAFLAYPHATFAAEANGQEQLLVFEVKPTQNSTQNTTQLTYAMIVDNDPLVTRVRAYLEAKNSPLAAYADQIVLQPQWQRALAISFVESNFGQRCADNNCSGIGVAPGHPAWRKYPTKLAWFKDMTQLLEKPIYKEKYPNCKSMKGVYVVPGSARWVNGCNKVSEELLSLTREAEAERLVLIDSPLIHVATTQAELK